ncbi:hypothetical protein [uncultured Litoreibacter sp.]|uniref:PepSY domain-containing protein n=1 Tax=uncultured Litoreibacter sp. TaxID=1392394 RepID=UPI002635B6D1|nr:hypothetical protein [uncultured Litoreibacter sp.]
MFKSVLILGLVAIGATSPSNPSFASSAREMGQSELRQIANSGTTVSMKTTLGSVAKSLQAKVVEARAFTADGIYYRFVLKHTNGKLVSVIIDAQTGRQVPSKSYVGRKIAAAASPKRVNRRPDIPSRSNRSNGWPVRVGVLPPHQTRAADGG